jgi:dTDP-4-amino-4,6-dideoxygalactose transaminase
VDQGSSYLLAETLAAVLTGQLENFEQIQNNRIRTWNQYLNLLPTSNLYKKMEPPSAGLNIAHMYYIEIQRGNKKLYENILKHEEIKIQSHYQPLCQSPAGKNFGHSLMKNSTSIEFSQHILRMPLFFGISTEQIEVVLDVLPKN